MHTPLRKILVSCTLTAISLLTLKAEQIAIIQSASINPIEQTAASELAHFLTKLYPEAQFSILEDVPESGKYILLGTENSQPLLRQYVEASALEAEGSYVVSNSANGKVGIIAGNHPRAVIDGVYALLERMGYAFYLEYNIEPEPTQVDFSFTDWQLSDTPLVQERFVLNWHNFLSGITGWDIEHYKKWIRQTSRMGHNGIMLHFYGNNPAFQFNHNGQTKEVGFMGATHKGPEWGVPLLNDVRRLPGAEFLEHPVFSSKVALVADEQRAQAATNLIQEAFAYAEDFGMKIHLAVDMDHYSCNPQKIIQTLPKEARFKNGTLARPDHPEGYAYYTTQVKTLLDTYPQLDTLIVWSRGEWTDWMTIQYKDLPQDWQNEYDALKEAHPDLTTYNKLYNSDKGPAHFAYTKVTQAFVSIVRDLGLEDVKIGYGGWWGRTGVDLWKLHNLAEAPNVSLWVKDYNRDFRRPEIRKVYKEISKSRAIYPIDWAHHDDGKFVGRPFQPHENFSDMLVDTKVYGYGIVHWMSWPLDIFFKNLMHQAWSNSRNESYKETSYIAAEHFFGKTYREPMGAYIFNWWNQAPSFGYSTSANYMNYRFEKNGPIIPNILKNADEHLSPTQERIAQLEQIDSSAMSSQAKAFYNYFLLNEQFIAAIAESSIKLTQAKEHIQAGAIDEARAVMQTSPHTQAVITYAKAAKALGPSRGEAGHLIRIASVWLYSYDYVCAQLGLQPIGYNFGPIPIDPYAIGAMNQKFHFDQAGNRWAVHDAVLIQNGGKILKTRASGVINTNGPPIDISGFNAVTITTTAVTQSSDEEIANTYVERDRAITLQLKAVTEDLLAGTYDIDLYFPASLATAPKRHILKITFNQEEHKIDLYNPESNLKKVRFEAVKAEGPSLNITIEGIHARTVISGARLQLNQPNQ